MVAPSPFLPAPTPPRRPAGARIDRGRTSVVPVNAKAGRRAAREQVAGYHEACLRELIDHVARAVDRYRAGQIDAYAVDEAIHHYHRAARELWKFCWSSGAGVDVEFIAHLIREQTANNAAPDWWQRGAPRQR